MRCTMRMGPNFRKTLDRLGGWQSEFGREIDASLGRGAQLGAAEVKKNAFGPGGTLTARSGDLQSAVRGKLIGDGAAVIGVPKESPASAYAGIQEGGGTILAKPKGRGRGWLTIPTEKALTGSGRIKKPARDYSDLVFIKVRETLALLVKNVKGKHARSEIFFVLVRKVTIRATHWLSNAVREHARPVIVKTLQSGVDRFFSKG